jgi:hypothetical protein
MGPTIPQIDLKTSILFANESVGEADIPREASGRCEDYNPTGGKNGVTSNLCAVVTADRCDAGYINCLPDGHSDTSRAAINSITAINRLRSI